MAGCSDAGLGCITLPVQTDKPQGRGMSSFRRFPSWKASGQVRMAQDETRVGGPMVQLLDKAAFSPLVLSCVISFIFKSLNKTGFLFHLGHWAVLAATST